MVDQKGNAKMAPLYNPRFEHDNCGIGACVDILGRKTHKIVENALSIVETLKHRAGKDAKGETGDGVGILTQIPHTFFKELNIFALDKAQDYGVAMCFFPMDEQKRNECIAVFEECLIEEDLHLIGWRNVPVDESVLGEVALSSMPYIMQAFVQRPSDVNQGIDFDRRLYVVRRMIEKKWMDAYICSFSSRTIVYKGMFLVNQLRQFYLDLQDESYESAIALVHSRFSTNTNPSWQRAHPNRLIVHNGEINTIHGNRDKMLAREQSLSSSSLKSHLNKVFPSVDDSGSDSAMLDNALEFLMMSGVPVQKALMTLIPEPWSNNPLMSDEKKAFYQYYASMMEPWDGPASILFSDGDVMGAVLDRNGLRPSRYMITKDHQLILSSEVGVLDVDIKDVILKDRLKPGKMLLVDVVAGKVIEDEALKQHYAQEHPYAKWLEKYHLNLADIKVDLDEELKTDHLIRVQKAFNYSYEEVHELILPMAKTGNESIGAMGVDAPLPIFSSEIRPLFDSFKQLFAQVTNPPIDALREEIVTSTGTFIGNQGNIVKDDALNCKSIYIDNLILSKEDVRKIESLNNQGFKHCSLSTLYTKDKTLKQAIDELCEEALNAFNKGVHLFILSDEHLDEDHLAIPSLLVTGAMNQVFVDLKKRSSVSIILVTAEPRITHHFACLIGYGASAVCPYLALDTVDSLVDEGFLSLDKQKAKDHYRHAIVHGIVKIASKMGISTIQSYQGSKLFEAIGISSSVTELYFKGTSSRLGGFSLSDIDQQVRSLHDAAFDRYAIEAHQSLDSKSSHKRRSGSQEHLYRPSTIHMLQQATKTNDYDLYKEYSEQLYGESVFHIRNLMDFNYPEKGINIDEVESVETIVSRFKTGAMSYGSISKEAHSALAQAMNNLHAKSNSGEGGEDIERILSKGQQNDYCSSIKQVASGRFGVTSYYLNSAKEIQIKMAQGAKPGEGGHLPSGKVYPWIAKTRHSTPGVGLISPPPHHDIYSIEDLAQLIYDLKNANRKADISVKLVSEPGVGTIASGVAKAGAKTILISGYDGGTGAAPRTSIYYAGLPWEIGLAETHQTLLMNGLRNKVRLETDGKLMCGKDVLIAALLGAEEFGFATAPLVTLGCVMMRVCHLDTCPVGIATQNPVLRQNFSGKSVYVENFMRFTAMQLREYMAKLGVKTVDELVGRSDLITIKEDKEQHLAKVTLEKLIHHDFDARKMKVTCNDEEAYDFELENTMDERVLLKAFENQESFHLKVEVKNQDRSFATMLGSAITQKYHDQCSEDQFYIDAYGSAGQSFGAFIPKGLTIMLEGEANDYFGKGLSGGKLVLSVSKDATYNPSENIVVGNVALYGATSGEAYIQGIAGERFCVRNSGATAVVEGVGDHGLEYMTGGVVVVLGNVGKNFAAGMSGGVGYVYDKEDTLAQYLNTELVETQSLDEKDQEVVEALLHKHQQYTGSMKALDCLNNYQEEVKYFKKVIAYDYQKMLNRIQAFQDQGLNLEEAQIQAFYQSKGV